MNIEEMIRVLEGEEEYLRPWHKEAIVDALKAGLAMRVSFNPMDDEGETSWASDIERGHLSAAGQEWDLATMETTYD
jgi:hypothetical protein